MTDEKQAQCRLTATVYGRVQGVSFRYYTRQQANKHRLTGWVANHADGTVRLVAEGPKTALEKLANFLRQGPRAARVENVDFSWSEASGEFSHFGVERLS